MVVAQLGLPFSTIAWGLTVPLDSEGWFDLRLLGETFESWERETTPAPFMIFLKSKEETPIISGWEAASFRKRLTQKVLPLS